MAELARKPLSPLRDEVAESPRPHPVAPAELRAKERSTAADNVRKLRRRQRVRWGLYLAASTTAFFLVDTDHV
jgi:hypothetical protein